MKAIHEIREAKKHWELQSKIGERAITLKLITARSKMSFMMDLDSVPNLDLDALLIAPDFDFAHDVCGIMRHMDRGTYPGKLTGCFVPRYSRNQ